MPLIALRLSRHVGFMGSDRADVQVALREWNFNIGLLQCPRNGHAQREVIAVKIGPIQIIKGVAGDGCMSLEGGFLTELQKLPLVRIDLPEGANATRPPRRN